MVAVSNAPKCDSTPLVGPAKLCGMAIPTVPHSKSWLPYVAPMAVYMAFLLAQSNANLLWLYPVKVLAVAGVLWIFRKHYPELQSSFSWWAVGVGLVAIGLWIAMDPFYPKVDELLFRCETGLSPLLHSPPPKVAAGLVFDPTLIQPAALRLLFLAGRVAGAVLVVPLMEELFWRAFLIRWLDHEDFRAVPVGVFSWSAFAITVGLFGAEHNQWLAGLICGALYNWLLYRTRSIAACVLAHAVSNAALAAWVLARGDWKFW